MPGNINAEAVRNLLEQQMAKGREPWEAAGEQIWMAELEVEQQLLSRQSYNELLDIVRAWLETRVAADIVDFSMTVAKLYAAFLAERVKFGAGDNPIAMLEMAWREWRQRANG